MATLSVLTTYISWDHDRKQLRNPTTELNYHFTHGKVVTQVQYSLCQLIFLQVFSQGRMPMIQTETVLQYLVNTAIWSTGTCLTKLPYEIGSSEGVTVSTQNWLKYRVLTRHWRAILYSLRPNTVNSRRKIIFIQSPH